MELEMSFVTTQKVFFYRLAVPPFSLLKQETVVKYLDNWVNLL